MASKHMNLVVRISVFARQWQKPEQFWLIFFVQLPSYSYCSHHITLSGYLHSLPKRRPFKNSAYNPFELNTIPSCNIEITGNLSYLFVADVTMSISQRRRVLLKLLSLRPCSQVREQVEVPKEATATCLTTRKRQHQFYPKVNSDHNVTNAIV